MIKHLLIATSLITFHSACSDDQQQGTEEPVEMSDEDGEESDGDILASEPDMGLGDPTAGVPTGDPTAGDPMSIPNNNSQNPDPNLPQNNPQANNMGGGEGEGAGEGEGGMANGMDPGMANGQNPWYVRCHVLRIRTGPSLGHGTAGFLVFNAEVHPMGEENGWIKLAPNKYVSKRFLLGHKSNKPSFPKSWTH